MIQFFISGLLAALALLSLFCWWGGGGRRWYVTHLILVVGAYIVRNV